MSELRAEGPEHHRVGEPRRRPVGSLSDGPADAAPLDRALAALLSMQRMSWEQGVASHALLDLGLDDLSLLLAHGAVLRQGADGRLGDVDSDSGAVNCGACGEAVWHAARRTGEQRWSTAFARQLEWLAQRAPRAADGTLFHLLGNRQVWVDTVYMVAPFLALAGRADVAVLQVEGHRRRLYDEQSGLYSASWDEDRGTLIRSDHWGTGNGWVVAGIARALRLSDSWPSGVRVALAAHAREVLDSCLSHRGSDGLFHDVLDDPDTFTEANVAQMLSYAAATGVADGWLPNSYAGVARDLLTSVRDNVDQHGLVNGVCGSPHFDRQGTSAEAQAFFLLAHAALDRLADVRD